jgi:CTP:molybdopterin cytidylyltransferase MocA
MPDGVAACVVALVDQPLIGAQAVVRLRAAHAAGAVAAVATYCRSAAQPGAARPVRLGEVAAAATGDAGARTWLRAHPDRVTAVPCDGTGSAYDIDTPDDLRRVQSA